MIEPYERIFGKISVESPKPMTFSIKYEWIIEQLFKRCDYVPEDIIEALRQMDKEQGKDES